MKDKRRSKRVIKRLAVDFGSNGLEHTGITHDLSKNGLCIRTTRVYEPGTILKINILLPNNGSTTFTGKVVRTYKHPPYSSLVNSGVCIELEKAEESYLTYLTSMDDD